MDNKVILTTTNFDALDINNEILSELSCEEHVYYSINTAHDENSTNLDKIEPDKFINSLTPNALWAIFLRRATNSASKFEGTWEPPPVLKLKFKDSTRR